MTILMSIAFGQVGCSEQPQEVWTKIDSDLAQVQAIKRSEQEHKHWQWRQIQRAKKGAGHGKSNKDQR